MGWWIALIVWFWVWFGLTGYFDCVSSIAFLLLAMLVCLRMFVDCVS